MERDSTLHIKGQLKKKKKKRLDKKEKKKRQTKHNKINFERKKKTLQCPVFGKNSSNTKKKKK